MSMNECVEAVELTATEIVNEYLVMKGISQHFEYRNMLIDVVSITIADLVLKKISE